MFTNSFGKKFLAVIFIIGTFLRFYRIEDTFSFDFDQEVAANAAYDFIKSGKLSLIGQELSYPGFFLGPLHNWIQIIPYSICNLKPDCTPYFFTSIGLLTAYLLFITVKEVINQKTAVISTLFYLISSVIIGNEKGPNSNYFLFPISILMLFCLNKYYKGEKQYLIAGSFFGGLAVVNFNPVFIFALIAYFIGALFHKRKIILLIISLIASLINIIPLVIFNFRHQNLLFDNLIKFLRETNSTEDIFTKLFFIVKNIALPYYNNFLFLNNNIIFLLLTFCILAIGSYLIIKSRKPILIFLLIWLISTVVGFTFYKRHIPDYYFIQTLLPFIIITSFLLSKNFIIFILIMPLFIYSNIFQLRTLNSALSYKHKKEVVSYVISDAKGGNFNVYYNFPPGLNTGYSYLFKAFEKPPIDYSKSLYIVDFYGDEKFDTQGYYKTFNNKIKNIKSIGSMKIITIKE